MSGQLTRGNQWVQQYSGLLLNSLYSMTYVKFRV